VKGVKIMPIKRMLITSLLFLTLVSCTSQQVTDNSVPTITLLPSATSTVHPTNTPLPASIVEGAHRSGMSPEEIVSFYWEIHSYLENNDVAALANKIYFPLNECARNKGDNIETKDEFIQRFNEIFTDEIISNYLNANLEDTGIDMYGVYIGGIWFTSICTDNICNVTETWIFGVNNYCSIRITPPMETDHAATLSAMPDYPSEKFVYGTYELDSYQEVGGSLMSIEELENFPKIIIERENFTNKLYWLCPSPEYEFNKPFYGKGTALWYGIQAIGELIVICNGKPLAYFDILANDEIGYYIDGYYLKLKHE
jgi:hypothetical protein